MTILAHFSDNFPDAEEAAVRAVGRVRLKRAESGPLSPEWTMEDHLTALWSRTKTFKVLGVDLLSASIRMFEALWPDAELPKTLNELAKKLLDGEDRLDEWRASAARVGADEALSFVLSWYEGINLDVLETMRTGAKYMTDPELIKKRRETAYSFIQYADIHKFCEPLDVPGEDAEDETAGAESAAEVAEEAEIEAEGEVEGEPASEASTSTAPLSANQQRAQGAGFITTSEAS